MYHCVTVTLDALNSQDLNIGRDLYRFVQTVCMSTLCSALAHRTGDYRNSSLLSIRGVETPCRKHGNPSYVAHCDGNLIPHPPLPDGHVCTHNDAGWDKKEIHDGMLKSHGVECKDWHQDCENFPYDVLG